MDYKDKYKSWQLRNNADDLKSVEYGDNGTEKLFHFDTAKTQQASQGGLFLFP